MEEIKFRAWDDEALQFAYSANFDDEHYSWGFEEGKLKAWRIIEKEGSINEPPYLEGEQLGEPQRFTGLHDKNGKEIYEGDVSQRYYNKHYPNLLGTIQWDEREASFVWHTHFPDGGAVSSGLGNYLNKERKSERDEVIGNICENPELLEQP